MLNSIVVPLDGSDFANRALPVADAVAHIGDVPLRILGVARADDEYASVYDHVHDAARLITSLPEPKVDIVIDPDPTTVMLNAANEPGVLLCFASHDRPRFEATLMHSVGSKYMMRATQPYVVVGEGFAPSDHARDVVVAVDGVTAPEPLLSAGASWAALLKARLRIVTVYEPVLADLRRPGHYTRMHGPPVDPDEYLNGLRVEVGKYDVARVTTDSIPDAISPAAGLHTYLTAQPAELVVVGGGKRGKHPIGGTVRNLVSTASAPLLVVNNRA
jgi:nucleotide-binding universal stress UspA family protein